MISLVLPPKDQISRASKMLADEYGTASNIKSRVNRQSVLGAIISVQQRLKLYTRVPQNGLVIYCGTILTEDNKEKKVNIDFEPFRPINTSLYLCDNKFHTEPLTALLEDDNQYGFIIMDGNGSLYGLLKGSASEVIHKFNVELPKKHGRGGQSALRFARLRQEKRHNYVRKVAEIAAQLFISNDRVTVSGLILAGSADFKTELGQSDLFDQRLQAKILKTVDISYGGESGLKQAIDLSQETLGSVKLIQEKKLIAKFFDEINLDTGKIVYSVTNTLEALELNAVEILIVWEGIDCTRFEVKNVDTGELAIHYLDSAKCSNPDRFGPGKFDLVDDTPLVEWLTQIYRDFGAKLEIVSDRSAEGSQFAKGFGGIGAILRYKMEDDLEIDGERTKPDWSSGANDDDDDDFF